MSSKIVSRGELNKILAYNVVYIISGQNPNKKDDVNEEVGSNREAPKYEIIFISFTKWAVVNI